MTSVKVRSRRKRKTPPIYGECACGEYCSPCLTTAAGGEVACHNCVAPAEARRGICRGCWKFNVPLEAHHIAGWRCSDHTVDVCINCHRKLSIMLQLYMELQGRGECDGLSALLFHLVGLAALFYVAWHRGDVDLQPFLKSNRDILSLLKARA